MGRRGYSAEFRQRVVDLVAAGRKVTDVARDLGISDQIIYVWRRQDEVDRGVAPGLSSPEREELAAAKRRIRELETELAVHRRAAELLKEQADPKAVRRHPGDGGRGAAGPAGLSSARVSESGYYAWRKRAPSARAIRHAWLTDLIREVHLGSRGTYGARRVQAELVFGQGVSVGHQAVEVLMRRAGIQGRAGRPRYRRAPHHAAAADLVKRDFSRSEPDQLWVTEITEHPAGEGKVYCAVVLDACSRKVVGWSINSLPATTLVTNALGMAIQARRPVGPSVIHSDQGTQFTSWAFTRRALDSGLLPCTGAVGTCFDNAMIESFWSRMQVELLDRQAWKTRVELTNAIFEYLEIFHNRQRRHSSLKMLTPVEFETRQEPTPAA